MEETLYHLCDWGEIEAICYSEHDNPHSILGPHITQEGLLINAFIPTAVAVTVNLTKTKVQYTMDIADEAGFFVTLIPDKKIVPYTLIIHFDNGSTYETPDPYAFKPVITDEDLDRFTNGIHYNIYDKLGAHLTEIKGVKGVLFAVWAPNAIRVSVVGDFNLWDGRRHPMRRLEDSGIFELFIPGITEGDLYKFELKLKGGLVMLKSDPYSFYSELRPATASIVYDLNRYEWNDKNFIENRKRTDYDIEPFLVYEVHLGSFKRPTGEDREFYNYRELAPMLCDYIKDMGYTHIELMPIMEHPFDGSWGYQVTGYYAATSRYGAPKDFMYFIDYMHQNGIGVILDWVPAHFPRDAFGLSNFDGTCLYEHLDPRQGAHPHWGTLIYNYGRPQVANFLIANACFWVEKYHVDGIRMDAVASMLYLDYGKNDGEWVANIYGGNENLEAIEMLKHLNTVFNEKKHGVIIIAEESTAWPQITGDIKKNGLGFHYKWNMGWMNDFINYMKCDPLFRKGRHSELTFSMVYAYSEKFMLVLSHDEVVHGKGSMINKMPGDINQKFANLRVAYGFMISHPGKKLLFMGQEFGQFREWSEERSLDWDLLDDDNHAKMREYVKALNRLYKDYPAFYLRDFVADGFEWINNMDSERSIISFLRKTERKEETLLIVCNFTPVVYEDYAIGVPFKGKYKEIFNSDKESFGGKGIVNTRLKQSKEVEFDDREESIRITVPPLGITVFTCTPVEEGEEKAKNKKRVMSKVNELALTDEEIENIVAIKKKSRKTMKKEKVVDEIMENNIHRNDEVTITLEEISKQNDSIDNSRSKEDLDKIKLENKENIEMTSVKEAKVKDAKVIDAIPKKVKEKRLKEATPKKVKNAKVIQDEARQVEVIYVKEEPVESKLVDEIKPKEVNAKKVRTKEIKVNKVKAEEVNPKEIKTKEVTHKKARTSITKDSENR